MSDLHSNSGRRCAASLFALAVVISATLAWYWVASAGLLPSGDEGHYLMIARSLAEDHDVELRGDYSNTQRVVQTFGTRVDDPHCWRSPGGWYSLHYPGLAAIVAWPYEVFGIAGARLTMCLIGALSIVLLFQILQCYLQDVLWSFALACFFYLGSLYLPASTQIFPDLPAGIAILAVADVCMRHFRKTKVTPGEFTRAVLLLALLPWLHEKYLPAVTILAATLAWQDYRSPSPSSRRVLTGGAVLALSVAGLFVYNVHCFGAIAGPVEVFWLSRIKSAVMVYTGMHLDQAQGAFFLQPLYLLGVLGLAALWRENRFAFLWLVVLYHAILLPNATHPNPYGGYSFAGRYLLSSSLLWIYPTAAFLSYLRLVAPGVLKPVLAAAALYQVVLACQWVPHPKLLVTTAWDLALSRNTLFGSNLRYALPSFYDPQLFAAESVNLLAVAGVIVLALIGHQLLQKRYATVRMLGFVYLILLALFSPGVPNPEYARDIQNSWMQEVWPWGVRRTFEVEKLYLAPNSTAHIVKDAGASGGLVLQVAADPARRGKEDIVFFGPYTRMWPGNYTADFVLRADDGPTKEKVAMLDVHTTTAGDLGILEIAGTDFRSVGAYQAFTIKFSLNRLVEDLEFRCRHYNRIGLTADRVDVTKLSPIEP